MEQSHLFANGVLTIATNVVDIAKAKPRSSCSGALYFAGTEDFSSPGRSDQISNLSNIETIQVHHLAPGRHEVMHERLLRVAGCIDFRECAELGVGTEDQIDDGA